MFTGLLPRAAGVSRVPSPAAAKAALAQHRDRMLPEVLRRSGYSTVGVTANLWCSPRSGFDAGFDDFEEVDPGRQARIHKKRLRDRLSWDFEAVRGRVDHGAGDSGRALDRWLEHASRDRPFFAFVNLMEAHSPYLPPLPYGGRSPLRRLRVAEDARRHYTFEGISKTCAGLISLRPAARERATRMYYAGVQYMDAWLGERLARLDELGRLDDTVVVGTADHGENLGENGLVAHALSLDNRLLHVPFVVAGPGADTPEINSLADLPRYIATRVGIDDHPWTDGPPAGYGVAQFDPPGVGDDPDAVRGFRDMGLGDKLDQFTTPLTCAVRGQLKLVRRGEREELFDLAADPLEESPRSPDEALEHTDAVAGLRAALEHPAITSVGSSVPAAAPEATDEQMRDLEERMRLLGYL